MKAIQSNPKRTTSSGSSKSPLMLNVKRDTSSKKSRVQRSASSLSPQMKQTVLSRNSKKSALSRSLESSEERATRLSKIVDPEGAVLPIEEVKEGEQMINGQKVKHFTYQLKSQNKNQSALQKEINLEPRFGPSKKETSPPLQKLSSLIPIEPSPRPITHNSNLQFKIPIENRPSSAVPNYIPNSYEFPKIPTSESVTYVRPVHTFKTIDLPARNTATDYRANQPLLYDNRLLHHIPTMVNSSSFLNNGQQRASGSPIIRYPSQPYAVPSTRVLSQPYKSQYRETSNNLILQQPIVMNSANFQRPLLQLSPKAQHHPIYNSSTPTFALRPLQQNITPPFLSSLNAETIKSQAKPQQKKMLIRDQTPVFNPSKQQALSPIPVKFNSQSYSLSTPEGQGKNYPIYDLTQLNQRIRNYTQAQGSHPTRQAEPTQVLSKDIYTKKGVQNAGLLSPERQSVSQAVRQADHFQRVQSKEFQPRISPEPYYSRMISQPPKNKEVLRDIDRHLNNQPYRRASPSRGHVHVRRQPPDVCVSRITPGGCRHISPPDSHKLIELQLMRQQLQSEIMRLKRSSRFLIKEGLRPCSPIPCDY